MNKNLTPYYRLNRPNSKIEDAWLQVGDLHGKKIYNPLLDLSEAEKKNIGMKLIKVFRDPNYLGFAAKTLLGLHNILPEQSLILEELWTRPFPMLIISRGGGKSFMLAVFSMLRALLIPNSKIVVVGAAFRQAKIIFQYCLELWNSAPIYRSVCSASSGPTAMPDKCLFHINNSTITFLPLGNGDTIRGARANVVIADEFLAISTDVFETVIKQFAATTFNPVQNVQAYYRKDAMKKLNTWTTEHENLYSPQLENQVIISSTADYDFMPFASYWKRYLVRIKSKNHPDKVIELPSGETATLRDFFPDGEVDDGFDSQDYSIFRIPYDLLSKGLLSEKIIASSKTDSHKSIFEKEYGCVFVQDSHGFFPRSLIQKCVAADNKPVYKESGPVWFNATIKGNPVREYVFGVDPAAQQDNFTIVILELWPDHRRVVYCWSTNMKDFQQRKKSGFLDDKYYGQRGYYAFCARKIRDLMKLFHTNNIAMDAQGGGEAVFEALNDPGILLPDERPIWPTNKILRPNKENPYEAEEGMHILHLCQFIDAQFVSDANHGLKKDMELQELLFPQFDSVSLELAAHEDAETAARLGLKNVHTLYDTFEDCVMEIEQLKNELTSIVMTKTAGVGRDKWDVPEIMTAEKKKAKMQKDRYSSLLMANYIARQLVRAKLTGHISYSAVIGKVVGQGSDAAKSHESKKLYMGADWYTSHFEKSIIKRVR